MQVATSERGALGGLASLVLPAYNAARRVERTWHELRHFLRTAADDWEILFVCDGCTDGTPELLERLTRAEAGRVRVLAHAPNRGKGYAVRQGLRAARGRWRVFTDIDLAYGFDDIRRLIGALRAGADVAIASRTHPDSRMTLPPRLQGYAYRRYLQSWLFSGLVRFLLPVTQTDTQAGLKGLTASAAERMLPHLRTCGFEFDCELLTACACLGLRVAEVPVHVRYEDSASTTGLRSMVRMLRELLRIRRAWRTWRPDGEQLVAPNRGAGGVLLGPWCVGLDALPTATGPKAEIVGGNCGR